MSIRIALDNAPEFYTNLDFIRGRVVLDLNRMEQVGAIIVKLEGESKTALGMPANATGTGAGMARYDSHSNQAVVFENHKILYKVAQVFPDESKPPLPQPIYLAAGHHEYPFQFKMPFNNACSDPAAMSRIGGLSGTGGFGSGPALFGLGGVRVMDGSRQLLYQHVTKTLPPSFTGFPQMAEIRYYIKITVQRPGLFKENWRYHVGLKFLPLEPPRPEPSHRETYARRPFTFQPRRPASTSPLDRKPSSLFGSSKRQAASRPPPPGSPAPDSQSSSAAATTSASSAPSIEMSARIPHPSILTCNQPLPLRLIGKRLNDHPGSVNLIALQIDLVGQTHVRTQDLLHTEVSRWVILSRSGLAIPVCQAGTPAGTELVLPDTLWRNVPLPNTVMPSFVTCNLTREYRLEIKLGLSWSLGAGVGVKGKARMDPALLPQDIHLPLHFTHVDVYSGVKPPPKLIEAIKQGRGRKPARMQMPATAGRPGRSGSSTSTVVPPLPARPSVPQQQQQQQQDQVPHAYDPLYPPQLRPGQQPGSVQEGAAGAGVGPTAPPSYEAPPSYDEAMAEVATGPMERPAYSGQTNENGPSTMPEKH